MGLSLSQQVRQRHARGKPQGNERHDRQSRHRAHEKERCGEDCEDAEIEPQDGWPMSAAIQVVGQSDECKEWRNDSPLEPLRAGFSRVSVSHAAIVNDLRVVLTPRAITSLGDRPRSRSIQGC